MKPLWVLDTNVLVSALLSKQGPAARLWDALGNGRFILAYDPRILHEYQEVLSRPRFGFTGAEVADLFGVIGRFGEIVIPAAALPPLPDPDDTPFLGRSIYTRQGSGDRQRKTLSPPGLSRRECAVPTRGAGGSAASRDEMIARQFSPGAKTGVPSEAPKERRMVRWMGLEPMTDGLEIHLSPSEDFFRLL